MIISKEHQEILDKMGRLLKKQSGLGCRTRFNPNWRESWNRRDCFRVEGPAKQVRKYQAIEVKVEELRKTANKFHVRDNNLNQPGPRAAALRANPKAVPMFWMLRSGKHIHSHYLMKEKS